MTKYYLKDVTWVEKVSKMYIIYGLRYFRTAIIYNDGSDIRFELSSLIDRDILTMRDDETLA